MLFDAVCVEASHVTRRRLSTNIINTLLSNFWRLADARERGSIADLLSATQQMATVRCCVSTADGRVALVVCGVCVQAEPILEVQKGLLRYLRLYARVRAIALT